MTEPRPTDAEQLTREQIERIRATFRMFGVGEEQRSRLSVLCDMALASLSATAPTGQRAVAETVYDNWSAYLRPCDRGDFKKKLYAIAATLPQQPAVAEGWVLVCRKCGADADQSCGWPMNCPAKHPKSAAAPKQEGKEEPR